MQEIIKGIGTVTHLRYLGDSVYIARNDGDYVMFKYDCISVFAVIYLEPSVMDALQNYMTEESEILQKERLDGI